MRFEVSLKRFSAATISECNICSKYPWLMLVRMDTAAIVVFNKAALNIIGHSYVPMLPIC